MTLYEYFKPYLATGAALFGILYVCFKILKLAVDNGWWHPSIGSFNPESVKDLDFPSEFTKEQSDWIDEIYKQYEEQDRKFEERMIELEKQKHRFDKLKSPKPRWIQQ